MKKAIFQSYFYRNRWVEAEQNYVNSFSIHNSSSLADDGGHQKVNFSHLQQTDFWYSE